MISLDLGRLLLKFKQVIIPEFIDGVYENCQGCYWHPEEREVLIGERYVNCKNGICLTTDSCVDELATCAHEFRHHLQWLNGITDDGTWPDFTVAASYEQNIKSFFSDSWCEQDALLFERAVSPNELTDYWIDLSLRT